MDAGTAHLVSQLGTLAIQSFFSLMSMSGKTEEELLDMFNEEREKFLKRDPANLPKPPQVEKDSETEK